MAAAAGNIVSLSGLQNDGSVTVQAGDSVAIYSGTSSGTITGTPGSVLYLSGMTFTAGSNISGDTVNFWSGVLTVSGSYSAQTTDIYVPVTFNTAEVSGSSVVMSPGNLIFEPSAVEPTVNFSAVDSSLAPITVAVTGLTLQSYGNGYGPAVLSGSDNLAVSGATVIASATTLSGSGSLTAEGGLTIDAEIQIADGYTLVNAADASWLNAGNIQVGNFGQIVNLPGAVFGSPGNTSTISLSQANFLAEGASTVNANVSNAGLVDLTDGPASLTINGSYTQTTGTNSAGTLNIAIDRAASGQYSQLVVNGEISLSGALDLIPATGFISSPGARLTLIRNLGGSPVSGAFSGYAEGSHSTLGGQPYSFTYQGGAGNDVVLTNVQPASTVTVTTTSDLLDSYADSVADLRKRGRMRPSRQPPRRYHGCECLGRQRSGGHD